MKKLLSGALLCVLLLTACKSTTTGSIIDPKLQDFQAMYSFLEADEAFISAYEEMSGYPFGYADYEMMHLEFTGDGSLGTILILYTGIDYDLPVIFIALEDGEYVSYVSDFWPGENKVFQSQDGFIIQTYSASYAKETGENFYQIGAIQNEENPKRIVNTRAYFGTFEQESIVVQGLDMKIKEISSLHKIDGYNKFETRYAAYFYDENGKEQIVEDRVCLYTYNANIYEHEQTDTVNIKEGLDAAIVASVVVGKHDTLDTFDDSLDKGKSFGKAMDYYMLNRAEFSKLTRAQYIEDAFSYINAFTFYGMYDVMESVFNDQMHTVTIRSEDSIPSAAKNEFGMVAEVYIEDGQAFDISYPPIEEYISYKIACIDLKIANTLKVMKFDKSVLEYEQMEFLDRSGSGFVDVVYTNRNDTLAAAIDVLYPTILVHSWKELKALEKSDLWKAVVLIVPDKVEYVSHTDEAVGLVQ